MNGGAKTLVILGVPARIKRQPKCWKHSGCLTETRSLEEQGVADKPIYPVRGLTQYLSCDFANALSGGVA